MRAVPKRRLGSCDGEDGGALSGASPDGGFWFCDAEVPLRVAVAVGSALGGAPYGS